jgi:DNA polymerase/3'-5' exonuclease PolX
MHALPPMVEARNVSASTPKQQWARRDALAVAKELCDLLEPVTERLVVAGSLRRRKPDVGDVEIIYIPKWIERPEDMFSTCLVSLVDEMIEGWLLNGTLAKRPSKTGSFAWGAKNKLALHRSGMPVDLFRTEESAWWNYLVCRTGPAESNAAIALAAQQRGYKWNSYGSGFTRLSDGEVFPMESEEAVFDFVGMPFAVAWER